MKGRAKVETFRQKARYKCEIAAGKETWHFKIYQAIASDVLPSGL